jgi:hypothetical protein
MNEHSRLDRDASQLGHQVTLLAGFIGAKIAPRGMDDKLGCPVRVPQREKRKCFGNFSTWGMRNGVSLSTARPLPGSIQRMYAAGLPFCKEPAREDDARVDMCRCEGATVVRTLRQGSWFPL